MSRVRRLDSEERANDEGPPAAVPAGDDVDADRETVVELDPADRQALLELDPADRFTVLDIADDYLARFDAANAGADPDKREAMHRAILMEIVRVRSEAIQAPVGHRRRRLPRQVRCCSR